jgi:hypothetical protein
MTLDTMPVELLAERARLLQEFVVNTQLYMKYNDMDALRNYYTVFREKHQDVLDIWVGISPVCWLNLPSKSSN